MAFIAGFAAPAHAEEPLLLTVDQAVLADAVDAGSRSFLHKLATPTVRKQVFLWMQLRGAPELLDKLKAEGGKLTVHHVWRKYVFTSLETRLDQPLAIGRAEDLQKLGVQAAASGYFTWRTWSDKLNLSPGNWRVDLEFDDHEPVMCKTGSGDVRPCQYPFAVN
ncbi:MAG: DUF2914 domain-containing protein [Burkholderiaceae bacterium]|nr:DUF2914 domain-containing protein [Burkholderiaceae bacterium]